MIIPRSILLRMRNVLDKSVEKIKTYFRFSIFFLNCAVYGVVWENIVAPDRRQAEIYGSAEKNSICMPKNWGKTI